jgi:hypothetical protein
MNYPIPPPTAAAMPYDRSAVSGPQPSVNDDILVDALQVVVIAARANGQTLADVMTEVLADDPHLTVSQRQLLSEIVAKAWEAMPEERAELATVTSIAVESRRSPTRLAG